MAAGAACTYSVGCNHGSHVAGIAAGATYASGGHEGVAPGAGIVSIQVGSRFTGSDCGGAASPCWLYWFTDMDRGLQHVLNLKNSGRNIVAVNLSLGGPGHITSATCNAAFPNTLALTNNLLAAGVAVVAAAGNNGYTNGTSYPSCLSSTYAVAATNDFDVPANFSNHNELTSWWAPGVDINAPVHTGVTARANLSGTSMAAPHVAGAFALLRECIGNNTPAQVADDLTATGVDVTRSGITKKRINVLQAATRNVPNNNFASARTLAATGTVNDAAFNVCADAEVGEPAVGSPQNSIWWSWTPSASGVAIISTEDGGGNVTTFDTELTVFTGATLGGLSQIAYDNDGGTGTRSLIEMVVTAGTTYRIRVDGVGARNGRVNLHIESGLSCNGQAITHFGTNTGGTINGTPGNDVIQGGAGNETINGGGGDDIICGGSGNDTINGGDGNDTINGGPGDDTLDGGTGTDLVRYAGASDGVTANLTTGTATGGGGNDTFIAVENLSGSPSNDTLVGNSGNNVLSGGGGNDNLVGNAGNDTLNGNAGNDTLEGGPGNDILDGSTGTDLARYAGATATVNANLTTGKASGGAGNDTFIAVENLSGSGFNDTLVGNSANNVLSGGGGNDNLVGNAGNDTLNGNAGNDTLEGGPGNDILDGSSGTDLARYAGATAAVNANLTTKKASGGAGNDTFIAVENLSGSPFNDTLIGNSAVNVLSGGGGNDTLVGNAGNDTLNGNAGNDTLEGGAGNDKIDGSTGTDLARYAAATAAVNANLTTKKASGGAGNDTFIAVENLSGSPFNDTLVGNSGNNVLSGGGGNDHLVGNAGNDTLNGNAGRDTCNGGTGRDTATTCEVLIGIP